MSACEVYSRWWSRGCFYRRQISSPRKTLDLTVWRNQIPKADQRLRLRRVWERQSHTRAVWLAGVIGKITLTRPGSAKENAKVVNTPIQEGLQLSSSADSYVVVEFENDSTAIAARI